jgi:tetratricopeptide (TPR) repeat protein
MPVLLNPLPKLVQLTPPPAARPLRPPGDGRPHPMLGVFEDMLRRARARKSRADEASALTDLGRGLLQAGDPHRALSCLNAALPLYRELLDTEREGLTLELVSLCHQVLGELPRATAALEQALEIAEQAGNQELVAARLLALGVLQTIRGQQERAAGCYERAAQIAESVALDNFLGPALLRLGETLTERGRPRDSIPVYRRALEVFGRLGDRVQQELTRAHLGLDLVLEEQPTPPTASTAGGREKVRPGEGLKLLLGAAAALIEMQQWPHIPVLADNIGQLLVNKGQHLPAADWFEKALHALDRLGGAMPRPPRGLLLHRLALAAQVGGDPARARRAHEQALPLLRAEGARREYAASQGNLGGLLAEAGLDSEALVLLKAALESARCVGADDLIGGTLGNLGLFYFHRGRQAEALPLLQESLPPLRRSDSEHLLGLVLRALDSLRTLQVVEPPEQAPRVVN